MLDPCCGEGVALAECSEYLDTNFTSRGNIKIKTVRIDTNEERACHAKSLSNLDTIVQAT